MSCITKSRAALVALAAGAVLFLGCPPPARAQLEVLLRGLPAAPPRAGACGTYVFHSDEPDGKRSLRFNGCVESTPRRSGGSVGLRFWSGDSLDTAVEVAPALFEGGGGTLLEQIRGIVEVEPGKTRRLEAKDWAEAPGLAHTPPLASASDSILGSRDLVVAGRTLRCQGRLRLESSCVVRSLGGVEMTQRESRQVETWTCPEAPILGLVRAVAEVRSERKLAAPVPGVPERSPRHTHYELELISLGGKPRSQLVAPSK